jgi:Protein kinase domain/Concanavalin A-like lectin/glucanases superfamily
MTADAPWREIARLFDLAVGRGRDERTAVLETCDDPALRREVESLLLADDAADGFLEPPPREEPGSRIGPYRLLRKLGEGETSIVYLAARDDQQYQQQVAIKLIRPGGGSRHILQRFCQERQILASLNHPSIARLFDGGCTAAGQPYFVMEYVDGEPLDEYCRRHGLSLARRLELFQRVCLAVHVAHRQLVVHRDLKPGNILVDADGAPRLLDFGIAKLLDPARIGIRIERTATEARLMTPQYASPEQVQGKPVGTASDVYSLGVILYKLITGQRPYELASRSLHDIARVVCESRTPPPSRVLREHGERVARDLDAIVLMAMHKEPERRYASALELADDIRRWLERRPLTARRHAVGHRVLSLARRSAGPVGIAVFLSLLGGLAATTWEWRQPVVEAGPAGHSSARRTPSARPGLADGREAPASTAGTRERAPAVLSAVAGARKPSGAIGLLLAASRCGAGPCGTARDAPPSSLGCPGCSGTGGGAADGGSDSMLDTCPDLKHFNACGEPQSGSPGQRVCDSHDDMYECLHDSNPSTGMHWELVQARDCLGSLRMACTPLPAATSTCRGGTDYCGADVTSRSLQIHCGRDGARYQCLQDGWHRRDDLGHCTQRCTATGSGSPATPTGDPPLLPDEPSRPAGLVAHWKLGEACNAATVPDLSGHGIDGIKRGGVRCVIDDGDSVGLFEGTGTVEVPDNPALHFTDAMTLTAWVRPYRLRGPQTIVGKWYDLDSYMLRVQDGQYYASILLADGNRGDATGVTALDQWQHVAGVFDGRTIALYVNGILVDSRPAGGVLQDSARPIEIGRGPPWNLYVGLIDEVRLYSAALTDDELVQLVQQSHHATTTAFTR